MFICLILALSKICLRLFLIKMNLSQLKKLTALPQIKAQASLSGRVSNLAAVLSQNETQTPPNFLQSTLNNKIILEDLKEKKMVSVYGQGNDSFERSWIVTNEFKDK